MIFTYHYKGLAVFKQMSYIRHKTGCDTLACGETRYNPARVRWASQFVPNGI